MENCICSFGSPKVSICQGDQYPIKIHLVDATDTTIPQSAVEVVEITIGDTIKKYPGDITYDDELERWLYPLTQEETFALRAMPRKAQLRVKTVDGNVYNASLGTINIEESLSKEVL